MGAIKSYILRVMRYDNSYTSLDVTLALMEFSDTYYGLKDVVNALGTLVKENKIDLSLDEFSLTAYYRLRQVKQVVNEVCIVEDE